MIIRVLLGLSLVFIALGLFEYFLSIDLSSNLDTESDGNSSTEMSIKSNIITLFWKKLLEEMIMMEHFQ